MEVLSPTKKHTQALEMVSEEEDDEVVLESEHEEGEIYSEEDDEVLVTEERRASKKPSSAAVTSEVVIYDDSGRTAIFTSPKKVRLNTYPRRGEGSRQHVRDGSKRKDKETERGRRHHSSAAAVPEKWPKPARWSAADGKGSGVSEDLRLHPHKGKEVRGSQRTRHSRQSSPESTSGSSSSSCSCSSSTSSLSLSEEDNEVASVSPCKGRGKENRRCGPSSKGHDRSPPPREYGCERPPPKAPSTKPATHHRSSKHSSSQHRPSSPHPREPRRRPSYHHNIRRSSKDRDMGKTFHQHRTHQKSSKPKPSERKEATKDVEIISNTVKGQSRLPRGSLGEMLLSRPKAAPSHPPHPAPATQDVLRGLEGEEAKQKLPLKDKEKLEDEVVPCKVSPPPLPSSEAKELSTLDQEDDEELQLRLIAIQSSLRLLTDMQKEGQQQQQQQQQQQEGTLECGVEFAHPTNKAGEKTSDSQVVEEELPLALACLMGPQKDMTNPGFHTPPLKTSQEMAGIEHKLLGDVTTIHCTDDIISISSSSASEICLENLATNNSYLEAGDEEGEGSVGGKVTDETKRKGKERPDVDQDPVDMEICDSSGEDEDGAGMVVVVQDSPMSPEPCQDTGQGSSDPSTKGEAVALVGEGVSGGTNFQIPVEWAYMVPPPPPPDQPANDLQNISSWCYDQNMYLQSMQAAPTEEEHQQQQQQQQQQHDHPDRGGGEWLPPHPQTASWPPPYMESYDNTLSSGIHKNTTSNVSMSFPSEQYNYPPPELPQSQEAPPEQSQDLKDAPAEQYQAFMSAVMQQRSPTPKTATTFTECPQRNLITIPLNGSHHSRNVTAAAPPVAPAPPAAAATPAKTAKKTKNQKLKAKKRRQKKQRIQKNLQHISRGYSETAAAATRRGLVQEEEEDDEDLLRAQLLIDMSRKKEQRIHESQVLPSTSTSSIAPVPLPAPLPPHVSRAPAAMGREGYEGRASPQTLLQSLESGPPAPRNLRMVKSFGTRPRSGENSPTHTFRSDIRPGLSDIGGWGLDPKGSKFNYHGTQHDFPHGSGSSSSDVPKVKFPPIKPVIINLGSDSEEEDEEEDTSRGASSSSMDCGRKEAEVEGLTSEPMSQSIDNLLKSMRNANTTGTKESAESGAPKPGPSTPTIPPTRARALSDTTPQAVRHLSRHQQEEYRWLKEQLRKKILQQKKMQQKPPRAKPPQTPPLSPDNAHATNNPGASPSFAKDAARAISPSRETPEEAGGEGTSSFSRAVTWKDMGLLQIKVCNEAAFDTSNESEDSSYRGRPTQQTQGREGDSPFDASATEDEDEETLRRMALLTQKKKMENKTSENHCRRVVEEEEKEKDPEVAKESEDVQADVRSEDQSEEGLKGEWMVLDEVREEGIELGEEEMCARADLSGNETEECGEGSMTSDSLESYCELPLRATNDEAPEGKRQDTVKTEEEVGKSSDSCGDKSEAFTDNTETRPCETQAPKDGSNADPAQETNAEAASKTDARCTTTEPDEKIKEMLEILRSKSKGNEHSQVESKGSNIPTQGKASILAWVTKKQQGARPPNRDKTDTTEVKQAGAKHPNNTEEADNTLVTPNNTNTSPTITTGTTDVPNNAAKIATEKPKEGKAPSQHTPINSDSLPSVTRKVSVLRPAAGDKRVEAGKQTCAADAVTAKATARTVAALNTMGKTTKAQLQLRRLEKEYQEKKNGINKIIMKLGVLLQEVNEEQQQRQALKTSVGELRLKLKEMEAQLESKSSVVQTKMEVIRRFQKQLGTEKQALNLLEHQGERMGKLVHGSGYSLPKALPSSPNSKTKDVHMKKALASSIHALRQQMHDLTNKRKKNASLGSVTSNPSAGAETRVARTLNLDATRKEESTAGNEKSQPKVLLVNGTSQVVSRGGSQGNVPPDTSGKPKGKDGTVVMKRKLVSSWLDGAKIAKVEVPMEGGATQERRVTGVPSGPKKLKVEDKLVEEKLDEMKALCPHDLLGRCNDSACQYQHLPSARVSQQPASGGSMQGTNPSTITVQGGLGKVMEGSAGKASGVNRKMVFSRSGSSAVGKAVPGGRSSDVAQAVVLPRPCAQQGAEASTVGQGKVNSVVPAVKVHRIPQHAETPTASPLSTPNTPITTPTTTETGASTQHHTATHTTTQPGTPTPGNNTTTPNTVDQELTVASPSQTESNSRNLLVSPTSLQTDGITTEPRDTDVEPKIEPDHREMETRLPVTENEMMATEPQDITVKPELEDETVLTEPQMEKLVPMDTETSAGELNTEAESKTVKQESKDVEINPKPTTDGELNAITTTPPEPSSSSPSASSQDSERHSRKPSPRPMTRKAASRVSTASTEDSTKGTADQEGREVEDDPSSNSLKEGRVTRKSLRVKAKVLPKSNTSEGTSSGTPKPSPRKNRKRKSTGEKNAPKSSPSKRRYPTRP